MSDTNQHSELKGDGESWEDYAHRLEARIKNQRDQLEEVQKHMDEPTRRARSRINGLERALGRQTLKLQNQYEGILALKAERDGLEEQYGYEKARADREKDRADALLKGYVETQEQAAGLLKEVQFLERENDNLMERLDKRIDEDNVFRVYDSQYEENQRLKADISGLCKREEAALTRARRAERRLKVLREQLQASRDALREITLIKPDTLPIHPSDNYKRARKAVQIARNALESNPKEER